MSTHPKRLALSDDVRKITTIIGGGKPPFKEGALAKDSLIEGPSDALVDARGNQYIAGFLANRVFKIDPHGVLTVVAGTGDRASSGDGGPATRASLNGPSALALDGEVLYIAEQLADRIRRIDEKGIITTYAGSGRALITKSGRREVIKEGIKAVDADLEQPAGLAVQDGELYFTEFAGNRVRRVNRDGTISHIAGTGERISNGDGGKATAAGLQGPTGIAIDSKGRIYVSEVFGHRVRRIEKGIISNFAGGGKPGPVTDGKRARSVELRWPHGLAIDKEDNVYIAEFPSSKVFRVEKGGIIKTFAGTGEGGPAKAGTATAVPVEGPLGLALDRSGNLLVTLFNQGAVVRITPDGRLSHQAGESAQRPSSDVRATDIFIKAVGGVAASDAGDIFVADVFGNTVHKVSTQARVTAFAGTGAARSSGDNKEATRAELVHPVGICPVGDSVFIVEADGHRVRFIDSSGIIHTIAGTGTGGFSGDKLPAVGAAAAHPHGIVFLGEEVSNPVPFLDMAAASTDTRAAGARKSSQNGKPYIVFVDTDNNRVRNIDRNGIITTIAGNGKPVSSGDGGKATRAGLNRPEYVAADDEGNIYVTEAHKVRKIDKNGVITTVAGTGKKGFSGAGGPATKADLDSPYGIAVDGKDLYIADSWNNVVWKVDSKGNINLFAGNGQKSSAGDGGPATDASLNAPIDLSIYKNDNSIYLLIGELEGARIRAVKIR